MSVKVAIDIVVLYLAATAGISLLLGYTLGPTAQILWLIPTLVGGLIVGWKIAEAMDE